jgi:hypothetical protein
MYTIIGSDQKEYGSVTADSIRKWIAEGRLNAQSRAKAEGDAAWRPLAAFPEFAAALAAKAALPVAPQAPAPLPASLSEAGAEDGRAAALRQVKGPAIALIITASLGVAYYGFSGLFNLFTGGMMFHRGMPPEVPPQLRAFIEGLHGPLAGVISLVIAALNGFVLFGAIKLLRLRDFTVAMIASVAAMLPCQCCCLFGLPFGIWALVVLNKPDVKKWFS